MTVYRIMQDPAWQAAAKLRKKGSLGRHGHDSKKTTHAKPLKHKTKPVTQAELLSAVMPYGKYKGWFITQLPVDYLRWASTNMSSGRINTMCQMALRRKLGLDRKKTTAGSSR